MSMMSAQSNHKIKSIILVASVAVLALMLGIMLDDSVVLKDKQPLSIEETKRSDKDKTSIAAAKSTQSSDIEQKKQQQSNQMKELDQKTKTTIAKAEDLTKQADQLISNTGLSQSTTNKQAKSDNEKVAKRLADVRNRLDALKK
jgi:hypothetical protein